MSYSVRVLPADGGRLEVSVSLCGLRYRAFVTPGPGWSDLEQAGPAPADPRVLITSDLLDEGDRARLEARLRGAAP